MIFYSSLLAVRIFFPSSLQSTLTLELALTPELGRNDVLIPKAHTQGSLPPFSYWGTSTTVEEILAWITKWTATIWSSLDQ